MKNLNARSNPTPPGTQLPPLLPPPPAPPPLLPLALFAEAPPALLEAMMPLLEAELELVLSPVEALVDLTALMEPALAKVWNKAPALERAGAVLGAVAAEVAISGDTLRKASRLPCR